MARFRHVEGRSAGPEALGVLVPPGSRTLVVVRPRALDCDLLLAAPTGAGETPVTFWDVPRDQAATLAQRVHRALERENGPGREVHTVPEPQGAGVCLLAAVDEFTLIACRRVPGQPYRPLAFATVAAADRVVAALTGILSPHPEANQELYLNLDAFAR